MSTFKENWQKNPKINATLLAIIVVIIASLAFKIINDDGEGSNSKTKVANVTQEEKVANVTQEQIVIKTSAFDLYNAYDTNEVATDEALKGAIIEITGTVKSIDKDFLDDINIVLRGPNEYMSVSLVMEKSEKENAINLRKGQKITARCKKMKRIIDSPYGSECVFMK